MSRLLAFALCAYSVLGAQHSVRDAVLGRIQDDACTFPTQKIAMQNGNQSWYDYYVRGDDYTSCMYKIPIDTGHFTEFASAINEAYQNYYAFYYDALNALKTKPGHVGPKSLGFSVYNGTTSGQVDLNSELRALVNSAKSDGATLGMFWDLQETFDKLRDDHVHLQGAAGGGISAFGSISPWISGSKAVIAPIDIFDGVTGTVDFKVLNGDINDVEMSLKMSTGGDADYTSETVKQFNGWTPRELLDRLANEGYGLGQAAYKALGPRVNAIIENWNTLEPSLESHMWFCSMDSTKVLPSEFNVTYDSGKTAKWGVFIRIVPPTQKINDKPWVQIDEATGQATVPVAPMTYAASLPGSLYQAFEEAKPTYTVDANGNTQIDADPTMDSAAAVKELQADTAVASLVSVSSSTTRQHVHDAPGTDSMWTFLDEQKDTGYMIGDDFAVLKLTGFENAKLMTYWQEMSKAAEEKGVDRLIIDISGNGGGEIGYGYLLAQCMLPGSSYEEVSNLYDARYTESMERFQNAVAPFLLEMQTLPEDRKARILNGMSKAQITFIVKSVRAIFTLVNEQAIRIKSKELHEGALALVKATAAWAVDPMNLTLAAAAYEMIIKAVTQFNPFTVIEGGSYVVDPLHSKPRQMQRGGKKVRFTEFFPYAFNEKNYESNKKECPSTSQFKDYIVLSDGAAGSTCNTFESTVSCIHSSGEIPEGTTYTTVSYGGAGKEETPVTQYAGGSVKSPNTYFNIIAQQAISMVAVGASHTKFKNKAARIAEQFDRATPDIGYYSNEFPMMPAIEIFNRCTNPAAKAMPFEYVRAPPLNYIPQFFRSKFTDTESLSALYAEAEKFFPSE